MSAPRIPAVRRQELGAAYADEGRAYHAVRPGYPAEAFDWLLAPLDGTRLRAAVDIGAGTGKSTAGLLARFPAESVTAVDPSAEMLAVLRDELPGVRVAPGRAEALPIPGGSVDAALLAQAWHWVEPRDCGRELLRVLRPGGVAAILINQLDVRLGSVLRLSRIIHAGDVYDETFRPALPDGFGPVAFAEFGFTQELDRDGVFALARSRSYWRRAGPRGRARLEENLRWFLDEHLRLDPAGSLRLPYRCFALRAVRQSS